MAPTNLFTLVYDALLRPSRFGAWLSGGHRNMRLAALATLEVLIAALAFVALVLGQLLPLGTPGLLAGLGLAPALALLLAGFWIMAGSGQELAPGANAAFWILRCQIAITPPLAPFLAVVYSTAFAWLQAAPAALLLLLLLFGLWVGGALTVHLALHPRRSEAAAVRWVVTGGILAIGGALWWSPVLHATGALLFAPACAGVALGLLRPLSYFWEAPLSLALALAAWMGAPAPRLLALHPVSYDELCLLPLPGLSGLLARACADDLDTGGDWLLCVAQHRGQRRAAGRAIAQIVHRGRLAHPLLFWLSTSAEGAALLRELAERSPCPHPLIAAYASLARVATPEAWPTVIARQHAAIANAADLPGGRALMALLVAGAGTLRAERWASAVAHLRAAPAPSGVEPGPIWNALAALQSWVSADVLAYAGDRAAALHALWAELHNLEGWPAALIAAMSEHLLFLLEIERRRGAWLV